VFFSSDQTLLKRHAERERAHASGEGRTPDSWRFFTKIGYPDKFTENIKVLAAGDRREGGGVAALRVPGNKEISETPCAGKKINRFVRLFDYGKTIACALSSDRSIVPFHSRTHSQSVFFRAKKIRYSDGYYILKKRRGYATRCSSVCDISAA
jgi:hypothetical protein